MTYSIGKRIAAVLSAAALLACLFAGIPSLTARAGETTLKSGYYVRVRSVVTVDADGWNSARIQVEYKNKNGNGEQKGYEWIDVLGSVDSQGDVFDKTVHLDGFPTRVWYYVDFGGGMTVRSWEADCTVYIDDVNSGSTHFTASSGVFSSSSKWCSLEISKAKYPYAATVELTAPETIRGDAGQAYDYASAVIGDQYGTYWSDDSSVSVVSSGDPEDRAEDAGHEPASGRYRWRLSSGSGENHDAAFLLRVQSLNTVKGTVSTPVAARFSFRRNLQVISENTKVELSGYEGEAVTLPEPGEKTGYTSTEWENLGSGSLTPAEDGRTVYTFGDKDGELRAKYDANWYGVYFNANGGSGTMKAKKYYYDKEYVLAANTFTKSGYVFVGWNTAKNGSGEAFLNSQRVTNLTAEYGGKVTLYAQWVKKTWSVTFVNNFTNKKTVVYVVDGHPLTTPSYAPEILDDSTHAIHVGWDRDVETVTANITANAMFAPEPHRWEEAAYEAPTCTQPGTRYYACSVCGTERTEAVPATGHDYEYVSLGLKSHRAVCKNDPSHIVEEVHNMTETAPVPATCREYGSRNWECGLCGQTKSEPIPMTEHNFTGEVKKANERYHTIYCVNCPGKVCINTDHIWKATRETPATLTEDGERVYTCPVCGTTKTEVLPAQIKAQDGDTEWLVYSGEQHVRARNGAFEYRDHEIAETVTTAATCTEQGVQTRSCAVCGYQETEAIPATDHAYGPWESADGESHRAVCANDPAHTRSEPHVFTLISDLPASCTGEGVRVEICEVCGAERVEKAPAKGHQFTLCDPLDETRHTAVCALCGETEVRPHTETLRAPDDARLTATGLSQGASSGEAALADLVCADCGYVLREGEPYVPQMNSGQTASMIGSGKTQGLLVTACLFAVVVIASSAALWKRKKQTSGAAV